MTHWQRVTTRGRVPVALGVLPGARHLTEGVRKAAMRSNSVWDDCCQIPGATVESLLREVVERRKTGLGHHTETNVFKKKNAQGLRGFHNVASCTKANVYDAVATVQVSSSRDVSES